MIYKAKMPEAYARVEWCKAQFGPSYGNEWWREGGHLYFINEQHYILYCLRWA